MPDESKPDTTNRFFVAGSADGLITILRSRNLAAALTHDDAINLAAWLVLTAHEPTHEFEAVRSAIEEGD